MVNTRVKESSWDYPSPAIEQALDKVSMDPGLKESFKIFAIYNDQI